MERNVKLKNTIKYRGGVSPLVFFANLSGGETPPLQSKRRCLIAPYKLFLTRDIEPTPVFWKNVSAHRIYRGCIYDITFTQNEYNGDVNITVDGKHIEGNLLPYFTDGKAHKVDVQIG